MAAYNKILPPPKWMFDYDPIDITRNDYNQAQVDSVRTNNEYNDQLIKIKDEAQQKEDAYNEALGLAYDSHIAQTGQAPDYEKSLEIERELSASQGDYDKVKAYSKELDSIYRQRENKFISQKEKQQKEELKNREKQLKEYQQLVDRHGRTEVLAAENLTGGDLYSMKDYLNRNVDPKEKPAKGSSNYEDYLGASINNQGSGSSNDAALKKAALEKRLAELTGEGK